MLVWFILAHRCLLGKEGKEARQRVSGSPSPTALTQPFLSWTPVLGLCGLPLTQGYFWWPGDGLPENQGDSLGQAERRTAPAGVEVKNSGRRRAESAACRGLNHPHSNEKLLLALHIIC